MPLPPCPRMVAFILELCWRVKLVRNLTSFLHWDFEKNLYFCILLQPPVYVSDLTRICVSKNIEITNISYFLLEPWHVSNCNSTELVGTIAIIQPILWEQLLFTYFLVDNQQLIHTCSVTYRTSKSIGESGTSKSNFSSSMRLDTPPIALGNATKAEFWIQTVCRNGSRHCQRQLNVILRSWKISLIMTDLLKRRSQGFYSMIMKTYQL